MPGIDILETVVAPVAMALVFVWYLARRDGGHHKRETEVLDYIKGRDTSAALQLAATTATVQENTGALGKLSEQNRHVAAALRSTTAALERFDRGTSV